MNCWHKSLLRVRHVSYNETYPHDHVVDHLLNVGRLIANSDLGQPRQVHQRQVEHVRRIHAQIDWNGADTLVLARHAVRLVLNLLADGVEIVEHLALGMQELAVLCTLLNK